jgi:hypothetical protein
MAQRRGAVVDDEARGHGGGHVAGAGRGVKLQFPLRRQREASIDA